MRGCPGAKGRSQGNKCWGRRSLCPGAEAVLRNPRDDGQPFHPRPRVSTEARSSVHPPPTSEGEASTCTMLTGKSRSRCGRGSWAPRCKGHTQHRMHMEAASTDPAGPPLGFTHPPGARGSTSTVLPATMPPVPVESSSLHGQSPGPSRAGDTAGSLALPQGPRCDRGSFPSEGREAGGKGGGGGGGGEPGWTQGPGTDAGAGPWIPELFWLPTGARPWAPALHGPNPEPLQPLTLEAPLEGAPGGDRE